MIINETNFILQLKKHNEKALEYVISKYGGLLKSVISKRLYLYPEDVEECLYDTFMKIWQNIDCYDENNISEEKTVNENGEMKVLPEFVDGEDQPWIYGLLATLDE